MLAVYAGVMLHLPAIRAEEESEKDAAFLESAKTLDIQSLEGSIIACERLKKFEMARALAKVLAERAPDNKVARDALGRSTAAQADANSGAPSETAEPVNPDEAAFDAAMEAKNFTAAESLAQKIQAGAPNDPSSVERLARVRLAQGRAAEAADLLEKNRATHSAKQPYSNALLLAEALSEAGRKSEALAVLQQLVAHLQSYPKETVTEAKEHMLTWQKEDLLVQADQALENHHLASAREALTALEELAPNTAEVQTLSGRLLAQEGKHQQAVDAFQAAKRQGKDQSVYSGQLELAASLLYTGRYSEAGRALDEVLDTPGYDLSSKQQAGERKRAWREQFGTSVAAEATGIIADEGDAFSMRTSAQSELHDGWRWQFSLRGDYLNLDENNRAVTEEDRTSLEGGIAIHRAFAGLTASVNLGGAEDHVLAGASLGQTLPGSLHWNLEAAYNELVQNSLQLQVLNARQHRLGASVECPLGGSFSLEATAHLREVEVDGTRFGTGAGVEYAILATIIGSEKGGTEIRAGYLGNVQSFNGQTSQTLSRFAREGEDTADFPAMLMERRINQHGLVIGVEGAMSETFHWTLGGASLYDFHDERFEFTGRIGLEAWLSDTARLTASFEYLSSGQGPNSGGSVTSGRLGMLFLF